RTASTSGRAGGRRPADGARKSGTSGQGTNERSDPSHCRSARFRPATRRAAGACGTPAAGSRAARRTFAFRLRADAGALPGFLCRSRGVGACRRGGRGAWKASRFARRISALLTVAQRSIELHDLPDRLRLFGEYDRNLSAIEEALDVSVQTDGDWLRVSGNP